MTPIQKLNLRFFSLFCFALFLGGAWAITPACAKTFDVKSYGAKGNGTTDDAKAIANAIAAANTAGAGNTVSFPAGRYLIASQVQLSPNGVTLKGDSAAASVIEFTDPFSQIVLTGNAPGIRNLTITYNDESLSTVDTAVIINNAKNFVIDGDVISNFNSAVVQNGGTGSFTSNSFTVVRGSATCINIKNSPTATFSENKFSAPGASNSYGIYSYGPANVTANSNTFNTFVTAIYTVNPGTAAGSTACTGNTFQSCYYGIYCQTATTLSVSNNTFNSSQYGVYAFYNKNSTFTKNTFATTPYCVYIGNGNMTGSENSMSTVTGAGFYIQNGKTVTLTNNTIYGGITQIGASYGIYVYNVPQVNLESNTISGGFAFGIESQSCTSIVETKNTIYYVSLDCIYSYNDLNVKLTGNDCGNSGSIQTDAIIYVNPASASTAKTVIITDNKFTDKSYFYPDFNYFILVTNGEATLSGNKTNTFLRNSP